MSRRWSHTPVRAGFVGVWLATATACGSAREPRIGAPVAAPGGTGRVANPDVRGVEDQPDWNDRAARLRAEVEPLLPTPLPIDTASACNRMLDAARDYYADVSDAAVRDALVADLDATRAEDLEACRTETSIAATSCVTVLLDRRHAEMPYLLDQCRRAFPLASR